MSVSTDLLAELDGWDVVSESLEAFRAGHEESGRFFAELLDRVDSLLSELLREQEQWRAEHQRVQSELGQKATLLHHQEQQIACEWAQIEQARAEGRASERDVEQQQRLEAMTSTEPLTLACRHQTSVGTDELVQRMIDTDVPDEDGFDDDAFASVVSFSSAPSDSVAAALPTVGTAAGREARLGVDYACGDQLIFTFVEDATATGGFRIEYRLLRSGADE